MSLIDDIKRDRDAGTPGPFHVSNGNDPKARVFISSNGGRHSYTGLAVATCHAPTTRDEAKHLSRPMDSLEGASTLRKFRPIIEANARRIARVPDMEAALLAAEALVGYAEGFIEDGCPKCGGDCSSAMPPVDYCPMREAACALEAFRKATGAE